MKELIFFFFFIFGFLGAATAEDVIRSTKQLTVAAAKAASAAQTMQQTDIIAAANLGRQAVCDLLATTRAAAQSADSVDARYRNTHFCRLLVSFFDNVC